MKRTQQVRATVEEFVVSLDSKREWYRYHALFAQALRYQLQQMHADLIPVLHQRASLWYAEHKKSNSGPALRKRCLLKVVVYPAK